MDTKVPSFASAKQQFLEKAAECKHMSTLLSLPVERQLEFEKMAAHWAKLAETIAED